MQRTKSRLNQRNLVDISMFLIAIIIGVNPAGWSWSVFVLAVYFAGRFVSTWSDWPDES